MTTHDDDGQTQTAQSGQAPKPLSEARLAEIRERWLLRHKARVQAVYGQAELYRQWLDNVGDDETTLLDEVDRLRAALAAAEAREEALVEALVEVVLTLDGAQQAGL